MGRIIVGGFGRLMKRITCGWPTKLAAILLLFPRRLQFSIPVGLNLLLLPGQHERSKMNCFLN